MSCHGVQSWTLPELAGAFVDLAVAHLLLLAAAITFFASLLVSFIGLRLPCSCPYTPRFCLRSLLSHGPRLRLASAHSSLDPHRLKIRFYEGGHRQIGVGIEESCGSVKSDLLLIAGRSGGDGSSSVSSTEGCLGSKGVMRRRRRRRKRMGCSAVTVTPLLGWQESGGDVDVCLSERVVLEGSSSSPMRESFIGHRRQLSPANTEFPGSSSVHLIKEIEFESSDDAFGVKNGKGKHIEEEIMQVSNRTSEEIIQILEKALEEERLAREILSLELEKERNASSTAADEAMAMIERLQNEKASINMNAKQYQRMIEEKTTYDEDEMELLKEIIVKQEREIFFMGKEFEMYRQMIISGEMGNWEEFGGHFETMDFSRDMSNMKEWQQGQLRAMSHITESNEVMAKVKNGYTVTPKNAIVENRSDTPCHGKVLFPENSAEGSVLPLTKTVGKSTDTQTDYQKANDDRLDFQEKGIVSVDVYVPPIESEEHGIPKNVCSSTVDVDHDFCQGPVLAVDTGKGYGNTDSGSQWAGTFEKNYPRDNSGNIDCFVPYEETECSTIDVHIIDDAGNISGGQNVNDGMCSINGLFVNSKGHRHSPESMGIRNIETSNDHSSRSWTPEDPDIQRSGLNESRMTLVSKLTSLLDSRRSTMSAVEDECSKLETEVEDLRKRLRVVQQGRKKLNISVGNLEKDYFHLQLLDEITAHLRDIKQSTKPERTIRHTSLPLPSSKVNKKKKRGRSESDGFHESS